MLKVLERLKSCIKENKFPLIITYDDFINYMGYEKNVYGEETFKFYINETINYQIEFLKYYLNGYFHIKENELYNQFIIPYKRLYKETIFNLKKEDEERYFKFLKMKFEEFKNNIEKGV